MAETRKVLIVDENDDNRIDIRKLLARAGLPIAGEARYGANAASAAQELQPDVILTAIEAPPNRALETIELLSDLLLETPIIAYSSIREPETLRGATRAGACDYLIRPFTPEAAREAIEAALAEEEQRRRRRAGLLQPVAHGSVITVTGAKGGVGKSIAATNLAIALRQVTGGSVALVDIDTHFGDVAMMMNTANEPAVPKTIGGLETLTRSSIFEQGLPHRSGVRIFPGALDPADWEPIKSEDVERFVGLLSEAFDFVVIDTSDLFDRVVERCVRAATLILLVSSLDLSSIADTNVALKILERWGCPPENVRLVMNEIRRDAGVKPEQVSRALNRAIFWTIPYHKSVAQAAQLGETMVERMPNAGFSWRMRELAGAISGTGSGEVKHPRPRGLLRLFHWRPQAAAQGVRT